jgi:hypothetical protein
MDGEPEKEYPVEKQLNKNGPAKDEEKNKENWHRCDRSIQHL